LSCPVRPTQHHRPTPPTSPTHTQHHFTHHIKTHRLLAITLALLTLAAPLHATPQAWQWTIPQRYEAARPFDATGLAAVRLGGKWGLIDPSGKQILPCAYDEILAYPEEKCFALRSGTQWGLADSKVRIILRPEWQAVQPLVCGFIPVQRFGKWGYADASGKLVIPCAWDDAWRFSPAGTAVVTMGTGPEKKRGFIDRSGRIITAPAWDGALNHIAEGLGAVRRGYKWAFVDRKGTLLGEPQWLFCWKSLRADLGFLPVWNGKWGAMGFNGQLLVPTEWESMNPGETGVLFSNPGAEAIFVGKDGETLFKTGPWDEVRGNKNPSGYWNEAEKFSEGFLAVRSGQKWGLIDEQGKTVIEPAWDMIGEVHEGLVAVKNKDSEAGWQLLNTDGAPFAIPEGVNLGRDYNPDKAPRFSKGFILGWKKGAAPWITEVFLTRKGQISNRTENLWLPDGIDIQGRRINHVSRNGRYGYIRNLVDPEGKTLMTDVAVELSSLDQPFAYPGPSSYGLATLDGKILVEPKWEWVEPLSENYPAEWPGFVRVWRDGRSGVIDSTGKPVIPEEMSDAEYVDYYAKGCIVKRQNPDGSTLWSLCDPSAGAPVHFENAARVYWNRTLAENGLLWIEERDSGQWALIRRDGTPLGIRQATKPVMWEIHEGFAVQSKEDGTFAFLGTDGTELAGKSWEEARPFQNGLAAVRVGGKWGFIDKKSQLAVPAIWDSVENFQNVGTKSAPVLRAIASLDGRFGLIDKKGNWLLDPEWEKMTDFHEIEKGRWIANVMQGNKWGCIDSSGKTVIEPIGNSPAIFSSRIPGTLEFSVETQPSGEPQKQLFLADGSRIKPSAQGESMGLRGMRIVKTSNGKSALQSHTGEVLIAPRWDHMGWVAPGIVAAWTDTDGGLFDYKGNALFRDNGNRRIARFNSPRAVGSPDLHGQGVVLIETPPLWGYAKFNPPVPETEALQQSEITKK